MTFTTETHNAALWADSRRISVNTIKGVTEQEWMRIGESLPSSNAPTPNTRAQIIDHLFYILLIRVVAVFSFRKSDEKAKRYLRANDFDEQIINDFVPVEIQEELHDYVSLIVSQYRDVHYHSMHHAYHVVVSTNKLLDMVLQEQTDERISTFGIKSNPLLQYALVFSALIHDVDHQGISNLQLVEEEDELAIRYNDQSVAEQQSLAIAFQMLAQKRFAKLKMSLFPNKTDYKFFRKTVIDLVLTTDVASPVRVQIVKSKFKEAFGETHEQQAYKKFLQAELQKNVLSNQSKSSKSHESKVSTTGIGKKKNKKVRSTLTSFFDRRSLILPFKSKSKRALLKANNGSDSDYVSISPCESFSDETPDNPNRIETDSLPLTLNVGNGRIMVSGEGGLEDRSNHIIQNDAILSVSESSRRFSALSIPEGVQVQDSNRIDEEISLGSEMKENGETELNPVVSIFNNDTFHNHELPRGRTKIAGLPYRRASSNEERIPVSVRSSLTSKVTGDEDSDVRSACSLHLSPKNEFEGIKNSLLGNSCRSLLSNCDSINSQRSGLIRRSSADAAYKFARRSSNDSIQQFHLPYHRRKSAPTTHFELTRKRPSEVRLGIRRAIDLSGNSIEQYPRSTHDEILKNSKKNDISDIDISDDEPDEFRASVVLETMLRAADISATMQCWKTMLKWSSRLFFEQMEAYESDRMNSDPGENWFQNQLAFFDSYVIPLAKRLDDLGVFGDHGQQFASYTMENRRQWVEEGRDFTGWMIRRWAKIKDKKNQP